MSDYGIITSEKDISQGEIEYDSRKKKIVADLDPLAGRADILDMGGGTIWTTTTSTPAIQWKEVLWTLPHGMPFTPVVYAFLYVYQAPGDRMTATVGQYEQNQVTMVTNAVGYGSEFVALRIDGSNLQLIHTASAGGAGSAFNGNGSLVRFRMKYFVTNIESVRPIYGGYGYNAYDPGSGF